MLRKTLLPSICIVLGYGFWVSPDFKQIAAGVAIFLFGMLSLEEGFRAFSGGLLERILHRSTDKLYKSLSFGVVTTTLMQSSSLVSVITISFLSAGMIDLAAGLGIIFGANLGTTTGAWLIAGFGLKVKISAYAMPMMVFGIILIFQKNKAFKGIGYILAGLGFLFLGIHYMKEGFEAFKETIDLAAYAVPGYPGLFLFAGIGLAATVVMQSSHATLVLIITALASGQITYDNALALAIGANVGTTITAIIGAMSANIEGKRLAGGHLIFNLVTGFVAIIFISPFIAVVDVISANVGIAADDHTLKLAVFHTVFNLVGIALMAPLIGRLVRVLERALPDKLPDFARPRHLNDAAIEFTGTALEAARLETEHLYENAFGILAHGLGLHRSDILSERDFADIADNPSQSIEADIDEDYENSVKALYGEIITFIAKAQAQMSHEQGEQLYAYRLAARNIVEAIKGIKHLRKNLIVYVKSDNPHIRKAYGELRSMLGHIMRELAEVQQEARDGERVAVSEVDSLKAEVRAADVIGNGSLDVLIREDLITKTMATSLMNDSAYAHHVAIHLIDMAEALFAAEDKHEQEAERHVTLTLDELDDLFAEVDAEAAPRESASTQ